MLNGQYIKIRVNGALMMCGHVRTIIEQLFGHCYIYPAY